MVERVAIVTGAASGIGRAAAGLLAAQGVSVAALDRVGDGVRVDVADAASVADAVARVRAEHGRIDVLVNAAGVAAGARVNEPAFIDQWDLALSVNLTGTMLMVRACIDDLVASGAGRIVNIASTEGLVGGRGLGPYSASKHGVIGFTKALAADFGRRGVTANCVCPGATLTGMTSVIPEAERDVYARRKIPVGRYGRPEEIAHMIVALAAPEASFVNGAVVVVDGGMLATGS
jgi:3-oxoacyl-[acyl-carrier protein] reductase